jgi:hypothetical protein
MLNTAPKIASSAITPSICLVTLCKHLKVKTASQQQVFARPNPGPMSLDIDQSARIINMIRWTDGSIHPSIQPATKGRRPKPPTYGVNLFDAVPNRSKAQGLARHNCTMPNCH